MNNITNILIEMPKSIPTDKKSIISVDLHDFGDACVATNWAVIYAVVNQSSAVSQGLVAIKSQI